MTKEDLFNLELGRYELTDNIYNYILDVCLTTDEKERCYRIIEKGSFNREGIFLVEDFEQDDAGEDYKILTAIASVGGLSLLSNNTFLMLNRLKFSDK